jgi:hypothetical protein
LVIAEFVENVFSFYFYCFPFLHMARLKSHAKKKLNKALFRIEKSVIREIRKMVDQQKKRKERVVISKSTLASKKQAA